LANVSGRNTTLDGLRGIAAISVCAYHLTSKLMVPGIFLVRGQIAVDFFFVLSGFVLALASEGRLASGQMSPWQFIGRRILRFFPMTALAVAIAAVAVAIYGQGRVVDHTVAQPVLGIVLSLMWLPVVAGGRLVFFPNNALWSLSGELAINIVFAFAAGMRLRWLIPLHIALVLAFAILGIPGRYVGYGFQELANVPLTLLRVAVSFSAGVLVFRLRDLFGSAPSVHPLWLVALLMGAMLMPGGAATWRTLYSLAYIVLLFPLLVWLAADARPMFQRLGAALGDLSFPLYAVHLPFVAVVAGVLLPAPLWVRLLGAWTVVAVLSVMALGLDRFVDLPLRKALIRMFTRRPVRAQGHRGVPDPLSPRSV
jgi:peptidoglycan/LPS O-acetylase OafA/YrhL